MATLDRIEPAYTPWTPSAAGLATDEGYVGKHRKPGGLRALSPLRMFYSGRHRAR